MHDWGVTRSTKDLNGQQRLMTIWESGYIGDSWFTIRADCFRPPDACHSVLLTSLSMPGRNRQASHTMFVWILDSKKCAFSLFGGTQLFPKKWKIAVVR
jgi:hypothetical protein